jgi:predicted phage baseplate assembly protein
MNSSEICQDKGERRRRIRERAAAAGGNEPNGIDYVEFKEDDQTIINVFFLNKAPQNVDVENIRITGGVRIRDIKVMSVFRCELLDREEEDDCLQVIVNKPGDFSTYTLRLVNSRHGRPTDTPLDGFDPRYAQIDFTFKASCASDLDCAPQETCYKEPQPEPEINYLAKDYSSFRRLILDRLSLTMPDWKERHIPDIGIALVELFAYVGDYLSYYQDAVATESYLDTARKRVSVRRHAMLIDYRMHEGCNARAWVTIEASQDVTLDNPRDFYFITGRGAATTTTALDTGDDALTSDDLRGRAPTDYEVFEPLPLTQTRPQPIHLYAAHNRISFYTWGDRECCLPRGATGATLRDEWVEEPPHVREEAVQALYESHVQEEWDGQGDEQPQREDYRVPPTAEDEPWQRAKRDPELERPAPPAPKRQLRLRAGDVLIFEEVMGPKTGVAADADASRRQAVRLTRVEPRVDTLYNQPVVEIEWAEEDALLFPLCLSSISAAPECLYLEDVSVARGNIILVDHGRTMRPERWEVPQAAEEMAGCLGPLEPRETILKSGRFRPRLKYSPVTHRAPFPEPWAVGRVQAQFLAQLLDEVRGRVENLCRQTRHGQRLSQEELRELTTIFGAGTLAQVGLPRQGAKDRQQPGSKQQAEACERLLADFDRFLAKKSHWVEVLRERILNGYTMSEQEKREIGDLFGERFAAGLSGLEGQLPGPASLALRQQPRDALPCIVIRTQRRSASNAPEEKERQRALPPSQTYYPRWMPRRDLLSSTDRDRHFVAEVDDEGRTNLRFGDGELGRAPDPLTSLKATYRTGNGTAGNVGAETISHVVFRRTRLKGVSLRVRNPLAAQGGIDPEPVAEVKMLAPGSVRQDLQRAIIAEDYARLAERNRLGQVQRATARLSWTGGWYEMQAIIDPRGSEEAQPQLLSQIEGSLYPYRRLGHDLAVRQAQYVPLDIALSVCVLPHYLRGHVKAALQEVFSNRALPGGRRGFFHPDNLTFGEGIYLSKLVAAAQAVEGVESVRVTKLQRLFEGPNGELEQGVLPIGPLEVARLDNDPNFPEHGMLLLDVRGGR